MAVADFVTESFETEAIRGTTAWRGVRYTAMGPWSAGTTAVLLADSAGNDGGAAGETVYAKGGPSNVAEAIAAAARAAGRGDPDRRPRRAVTTVDGAVTGVVLEGGEELARSRVVSGLDPKQLLTSLVDPVTVGPSMRWRAGNIRTPGSVAKVNLVLDGLPEFPAAGDDPRLLRGRIQVSTTSIDDDGAGVRRLEVRPARRRRRSSRRRSRPSSTRRWSPARPTGTQVMSVLMQWMPPTAPSGDWADDRESRSATSPSGRSRRWRPGSGHASRRGRC